MAKKRVKMLTSMVSPDWSVAPGDIMEVREDVADVWAKLGIAELVDDVEKASVKPPETAAKRRKKGD